MRRGFTLIELLVIIAIMATMVTVGVVGLGSSRETTRLYGAGRDVMAMIRRARSLALVTQHPVVIEYGNHKADGEESASVKIKAQAIFNKTSAQAAVYNLNGDCVIEVTPAEEEGGGETLREILSPEEIDAEIMNGLVVKVTDESRAQDGEERHSKISIFSTADNISRTYSSSEELKKNEGGDGTEESEGDSLSSVAFQANGMVDVAHRVQIYRAGTSPEEGITIHIDRFGDLKCEDLD